MFEEFDTLDRREDDFREMLGRAKDVTERLRGSIAAVTAQEGGVHSQAVDGKALHDDAHIFVKVSVVGSFGVNLHPFRAASCTWAVRLFSDHLAPHEAASGR